VMSHRRAHPPGLRSSRRQGRQHAIKRSGAHILVNPQLHTARKLDLDQARAARPTSLRQGIICRNRLHWQTRCRSRMRRQLHRQQQRRWRPAAKLAKLRLPSPREHQARRNHIPPRHSRHSRAGQKALVNNPDLVLVSPPPTTLNARQHLTSNHPIDLKARLKVTSFVETPLPHKAASTGRLRTALNLEEAKEPPPYRARTDADRMARLTQSMIAAGKRCPSAPRTSDGAVQRAGSYGPIQAFRPNLVIPQTGHLLPSYPGKRGGDLANLS
jgi:hypothetical protein